MVRALTAPKWPEEILGEIDQAAATRGYTVYNTIDYSGKSCASCHTLPDAQGNYPMTPVGDNLYGKQFIKTYNIPLSDIGTDATAANLLFKPFMAETGALSFLFGGAALYPSIVIERTVFGAMTKRLFAEMQLTPAEQVVYSGFRFYAPGKTPAPDVAAYRARPLPGIWATGPFLHNGSVRTLTELLKPSAYRDTQFYVGSRHFDPIHVGYRSIPSQDGHQKTEVLDTTLVGNSNAGHEYGVYFTEQEKRDLVEFLKTL